MPLRVWILYDTWIIGCQRFENPLYILVFENAPLMVIWFIKKWLYSSLVKRIEQQPLKCHRSFLRDLAMDTTSMTFVETSQDFRWIKMGDMGAFFVYLVEVYLAASNHAFPWRCEPLCRKRQWSYMWKPHRWRSCSFNFWQSQLFHVSSSWKTAVSPCFETARWWKFELNCVCLGDIVVVYIASIGVTFVMYKYIYIGDIRSYTYVLI